jgi:hypothetical protein
MDTAESVKLAHCHHLDDFSIRLYPEHGAVGIDCAKFAPFKASVIISLSA